MGRYHQTTDLGTSVVEVQRKTMAFSKAFILSLLGLALSRPNLQLMEDLEASGMMEDESSGQQPRLDLMDEEGSGMLPRLDLMEEDASGLQPRLDMMEEESSGMQPRLDIVEMNGSGFQDFKALNDEELGSADFRMAELFEASGAGDETMMLLVKGFEGELGSGDLRSVEIGSGLVDEVMSSAENGLIRSVETEDVVETMTEAVHIIEDREPKKKARLLSKFLSNVGSIVEEIVTRKQNLAEEALKVKLNLSQGIIDAKKDLVQHFI